MEHYNKYLDQPLLAGDCTSSIVWGQTGAGHWKWWDSCRSLDSATPNRCLRPRRYQQEADDRRPATCGCHTRRIASRVPASVWTWSNITVRHVLLYHHAQLSPDAPKLGEIQDVVPCSTFPRCPETQRTPRCSTRFNFPQMPLNWENPRCCIMLNSP